MLLMCELLLRRCTRSSALVNFILDCSPVCPVPVTNKGITCMFVSPVSYETFIYHSVYCIINIFDILKCNCTLLFKKFLVWSMRLGRASDCVKLRPRDRLTDNSHNATVCCDWSVLQKLYKQWIATNRGDNYLLNKIFISSNVAEYLDIE